MQSAIRVTYDERQSNKLLIQKQIMFRSLNEAVRFSREIYMSGVTKTKPVLKEVQS